jgi:hypothetical protein
MSQLGAIGASCNEATDDVHAPHLKVEVYDTADAELFPDTDLAADHSSQLLMIPLPSDGLMNPVTGYNSQRSVVLNDSGSQGTFKPHGTNPLMHLL